MFRHNLWKKTKNCQHNPVYKFKYRSNQAQHDFSSSIRDQLEALMNLIKRDPNKRSSSHPEKKMF